MAEQRRTSNAPAEALGSTVVKMGSSGSGAAGIGSWRQNAFQWRNLYHHRYGIATYPPPVPRNPSTTTATYPNIDAYMAIREQDANSSNAAARKSMASTVLDAIGSAGAMKQRSTSFGARPTSPPDSTTGAGDGGSQHRVSDGLSPNGRQYARNALFTRSSFLIQRKAQLLLNKKREVEELRKQNPHALEQCVLTIHQRAWVLLVDDSVTKATALEAKDYGDAARDMKERLHEQMRRNIAAMGGDSPFALDGPDDRRSPSQDKSGDSSSKLPAAGFLRHGDHAVPSGSTNPVHASITAERDRRLNLLSEFAPFFAIISPPSTVSSMHAQATPVYGRYTLPTPGGSGDTVGLPLFSQYNTWEEACRQREAWPRAPFHFFLTRDVSFHFAHVTAAILMLETVGKYLHRHRCTNPPLEASSGADGGDGARRRGKSLVVDANAATASFANLLGAASSQGVQQAGEAQTAPTPVPEFWDGHRRIAPDTKCSTQFNPSSCPYLAMEQLSEDVIVVFEHVGARNALPMMTSMVRLFLDKALRPGLSTQLFGKTALLDVYFNDTRDDDLSASGSSGDEDGAHFGGGRARGAPFGASGSHAAAATHAMQSGTMRTSGVPPALAHLLAPLMRVNADAMNGTSRHNSLSGTGGAATSVTTGQPPPPRRPLDESSSSSSDDDDDANGKGGHVGGASLFSEREFHALFSLSMWFVDSSTATATTAQLRPAAPGSATGSGLGRKRSKINQQQSQPKMAPGYTRIQNTARAPTLGIAEAVVRFEFARKLRLKAISRRERQLLEEAEQNVVRQREEQEKERLRELDEARRRQIHALQQSHNQHHATQQHRSPNHSRSDALSHSSTSSKENSYKAGSGSLEVSAKAHTSAPPPSNHSHSNKSYSSHHDVLEFTARTHAAPEAPLSLRVEVPPVEMDEDDAADVDFFVDASAKRNSKFGPLMQSAVVGDSAATPQSTAVTPRSQQFLSAPGGPHGQRHTLLPPTHPHSASLSRTVSPPAIPIPKITHLAPPTAAIALPPTAEESTANVRQLITSLRSVVDDEMPVAATKLATPLILMSSYMKLHGVGWCRDVCRSLLDYLSYPDIFLYVTDDDLLQPPPMILSTAGGDHGKSMASSQHRSPGTAKAHSKSPSTDPVGLSGTPPLRPQAGTHPISHRTGSDISATVGGELTPFAAQSSSQNRKASYFSALGPVVFSRAGSVATEATHSPRNETQTDMQETSTSRLSISMLGNQISPRALPPQQWRFPIEEDAPSVGVDQGGSSVKNLSVSAADPSASLPTDSSLRPPFEATPTPQHGISDGAAQTSPGSTAAVTPPVLPYPTEGLDPPMVTFLNAMLRKESAIAEHIQKALEIWFETLERSHASQKIPSGIAYLLTAMCASVHSHLLSGVVMTSALEVDGIEPDSVEFVDHLIQTLVGATSSSTTTSSNASTAAPTPGEAFIQPADNPLDTHAAAARRPSSTPRVPKTPAPPPLVNPVVGAAPTARRRATVILDPEEAIKEQSPTPALPLPTSGAAADNATPSPAASTPAAANSGGASGTISLVSDVQTYRLAKFILFDVWLLPMLNNAQRYGLIPPHAPPHLINNINAFVRYAKIVVNAPYTQRDEERRKHKQQQQELAAQAAATVAAMATSGSEHHTTAAAPAPPPNLVDVDSIVPPEYTTALRRSALPGVISGVYNSSNGTLVQLFRFPQDFISQASGGAAPNSVSGAADARKKSPGTPTSSGGRRRSNQQGGGFTGAASRRNMTRIVSAASARLTSFTGDVGSSGKKGSRISSAAILASSGMGSVSGAVASDYYTQQNGAVDFPTMSLLSPSLQQLNVALGVAAASRLTTVVVSATVMSSSQRGSSMASPPSQTRGASTAAVTQTVTQQLDMFCWHASTDEDRHRVVSEFQVPSAVAVTCTENIYKVITGQHPATMALSKMSTAAATKTSAFGRSPSSVNISPDATPMPQRLSVVSSGSGGDDTTTAQKSPRKQAEGEPSKDAVDLYLRCLHSVLLHPTTAGQALDCMSLNHRKMFQQLMRVPPGATSAAAHASGSSLANDATSLACSLYPYLLVGVRDQPLVDVNAIAMLTSASLVTQSDVPLPSSFIQARRRFLARQLFLATGARIGLTAPVSSNAPTSPPGGGGHAAHEDGGGVGDSPTHPTSPTRGSRRRVSRSVSIGHQDMRPRGLGEDPEDGPVPQPLFAAWWCYIAAALCAKAECVLEESSAFLSKRWDRKCRQTMRRYSHRDSVVEATFSTIGNNNAAKSAGRGGAVRGGAPSKDKTKDNKKVQLPKIPSSVKKGQEDKGAGGDAVSLANGGGLLMTTSRFGGGDAPDAPNTARRLSTSSTVAIRKSGAGGINHPLMQRWRDAVTDSVDKSDDRAEASNSNSSRPSRAPSVSLETPRLAPRAPVRR